MEIIRPFSRITKNDVGLAGGKGASLGEMTSAGIPVPPGFVILSTTFDHFIDAGKITEDIDAILHAVDHKNMETVEKASEKIQSIIVSTEMPNDIEPEIQKAFRALKTRYVAVRSSATSEDSSTAAWAGQLDSFLNTTSKTLLDNVKKCWASLFTPRAIFYRFEKNLHLHKISVAVVVQTMVESEISGVAFSVHPVTEDYNQLIIEAGFGLGEAIVSGQITPDSYVVEKKKLEIIEKNVSEQTKALFRSSQGGNEWKELGEQGKKQALTEKEVFELSKLIIRIEKHYGFPVDIEWCLEKGKFFIVQSRPITTLEKNKPLSEDNFKTANNILKKYNVSPPFIHKGFHAYFFPIDFVQLMWNVWGKYDGYYYKLHISALHNDYWDMYYVPEEFTSLRNHYLQKVHENKNYLKKHYQDWRDSCRKLSSLIGTLDAAFKNQEGFSEIFAKYQKFATEYVFEYALAAPIQEACGFQPEQWINPLLEEFCQQHRLHYQETSALLTSPVVHSFITQEEIDLLKIAISFKKEREKEKLEDAISKHQSTWFWIQNNYATIKVVSPEDIRSRIQELQHLTLQDLKNKLNNLEKIPVETKEKKEKLFQKYKPKPRLRLYLKITELFSEIQDVRKSFVLKANHYHKLFVEAVALKYQQPVGSLWYYTYGELCHAIKSGSFINQDDIKKRKIMIVEVESKPEKIILSGPEAKYFYDKLQVKIGNVNEFSGIVAQSGKVKGKVVIVLKSHDLLKFSAGDILVSSMTRPEMTPAMQKAAAFVTDEGGITSHAAIISREMKKPCIIGTKIATKVLKDGDLVEVDANKGIVKILKRKGKT